MTSLDVIEIGGQMIAIQGARWYRQLRSMGVTIRKTIDTVIATRCIMDGYELLFTDRDFDPFVKHLGSSPVLSLARYSTDARLLSRNAAENTAIQ